VIITDEMREAALKGFILSRKEHGPDEFTRDLHGLRSALDALSAMPEPGCEWALDDDGNYSTGCGQAFVIEWGDLDENGYKYCPTCGRKIHYTPKEAKE
jgi:hypothetical protein